MMKLEFRSGLGVLMDGLLATSVDAMPEHPIQNIRKLGE